MIYIWKFEKNSIRTNRPSRCSSLWLPPYCMGVSKSSLSLIDPYRFRPGSGADMNPKRLSSKPADRYLFTRSGIVGTNLMGLRAGVYQGLRFHVFRIRREIVGARFSDLVPTRKLSPNIGLKKSHGYSRVSRKKLLRR